MTSPQDFFADVERDHSGRPMIVPALGGPAVPYTRASALAEYITDHRHIHTWRMRYLAKAMGQNPDLADLAAVEVYSTGFDEPERAVKSASGKRLDKIVERALDRAGILEKADYGTAVHAATEPPAWSQLPPSRIVDDVEAFKSAIIECGIEILATEVFTAQDHLQAAGTFDHLVWAPGYGVVILDKKTGNFNPHEFGVQFSTYAHGDVYDVETCDRRPLESLAHPDGMGVNDDILNREVGLAAMIKNGQCEFKEVDLVKGWRAACAAAEVRDYVEDRSVGVNAMAYLRTNVKRERAHLQELLIDATTRDEALAIWEQNKHLWTPDHTAYLKMREL